MISKMMLLVALCVSVTSVAEIIVPFENLIGFKVEKYKLKNGLTVLLHEDHSAPYVSIHQWFRVGSVDEKPGRTGLAHFFEHLMFKGTPKYSGDAIWKKIQSSGGDNNAFTSKDYTGYYANIPSDDLELILDIESDRMTHLRFLEKEITSEREVVKEERRYRVENSTYGTLSEATFRTVFKVHPYRWPVIGYMKDLNAASIDDMKSFYKTFYSPNNATLVVVGDFKTASVKSLIDKYYGAISPSTLPKREFSSEPKQTWQRQTTVEKSIESPTVAVVYQAPKAGEKEVYALDLLSNILSEGRSSRLYQRMVYKQQLAESVSTSSYTPQFGGIFQVVASLKPGKSVESALTSIMSEIYKSRSALVTDKELQKAKNQVMSSYVNSLKTIPGKAHSLALNETLFGDYSVLFKDLGHYQAVTANEIQEVAKKYLNPGQSSIIRVVPKK